MFTVPSGANNRKSFTLREKKGDILFQFCHVPYLRIEYDLGKGEDTVLKTIHSLSLVTEKAAGNRHHSNKPEIYFDKFQSIGN